MDLGVTAYERLVRLARLWFSGCGANVWVRNGVRLRIVQPLISDIDLTFDCRGLSEETIRRIARRYHLLKRLIPLFGEANWVHSRALGFVGKFGNVLELRRDPELTELMDIPPEEQGTTAERVVFLLRMIVADRANLRVRPASRRRKWEAHLKSVGLEPVRAEFNLDSLTGAISPLLEEQGGLSAAVLRSLIAHEDDHKALAMVPRPGTLVFLRRWLTDHGSPERFAWALNIAREMNIDERDLLRAQLLWELAYVCLSEARTDGGSAAESHAENILILLRAIAEDWTEIFEAFSGTGILRADTLDRVGSLKLWKSLPSCAAPWSSLCIHADGRAGYCESAIPFTPAESAISFDELFRSGRFETARQETGSGIILAGCDECKTEESLGAGSLRMRLNDETGIQRGRLSSVPHLRRLHLSFGNECALTCMTCSSRLSSSWAGLLPERAKQRVGAVPRMDPRTLSELREVILAGGDPFESDGHVEFLERCISNGNVRRLTLSYRMCSAADPRPFFRIWRQFGRVNLNLWLDGHYEAEPYIRHPLGWGEYSRRVRLYDDCPENVAVDLGCQVHALSASSLPELCSWIEAQEFRRIGTGREGRRLMLDFVSDVNFLSVRNCPSKLKEKVRDTFFAPGLERYVSSTDRLACLNRMNSKAGNPALVLKYCEMLDALRGTSFRRAFPGLVGYFES